ncbi:hypothetical protein RFI_27341, partial [Reticulomyxa filosa]
MQNCQIEEGVIFPSFEKFYFVFLSFSKSGGYFKKKKIEVKRCLIAAHMRSLFLSFIALANVCNIVLSCTQISVQLEDDVYAGGEDLDWIQGVFRVDPTLQVNDRFVYKEVNGTRVIYHYSGKESSDDNWEAGRWMLSSIEEIKTDSGWAYRSSWSISPDDRTTASLQNNPEINNVWK